MSNNDTPTAVADAVFTLVSEMAAIRSRQALVEDRLETISAALDAIEAAVSEAAAAAAPPPQPPAAPAAEGLDMSRLIGWVGDNVADLVERRIPQTGGYPHWCRSWWRHPEAIARFEAARRAWAGSVTEDGAVMAVYFEHLDHQLAQLCSESGPFSGCTGGQHQPTTTARPLGQQLPGPDYFLQFGAGPAPDPGDTDVGTRVDQTTLLARP